MRQLSNADVYGVPSEADMADMQLRPTTAGGTPLNAEDAAARNSAYLNNPVLNARKMSSGHVRFSLLSLPCNCTHLICLNFSRLCAVGPVAQAVPARQDW